MHSHDRTLLARLGFADPDKRNPRHDLACQYLAGRADDILARFWRSQISTDPKVGQLRFEVPLNKGTGQYMTTVGFIDLHIPVNASFEVHDLDYRSYPPKWVLTARQEVRYAGAISIEVKIGDASVGDMLRQVGLYREYRPDDTWVIATSFPMARAALQSLESNRIHHVMLGRGFEEWIENQRRREEQDPPVMMEI